MVNGPIFPMGNLRLPKAEEFAHVTLLDVVGSG